MYRFAEAELLAWKETTDRLPLLVRGARQVGKSFLVEQFGREHFSSFVVINFEFERRYRTCFETLDPEKIILNLSLISGKTITPGETLLFLDEIQECPQAILALRYFKEKMPDLHVIAAGSLLEFTLNQAEFRMPVGRAQSLYLKPLSFYEFLLANDGKSLVTYLESIDITHAIDSSVHELLLEKCREYFVVGGMPAVVKQYIENKNGLQSQVLQGSLLEYYQKDFWKYQAKVKPDYLQTLFDKIPGLVSEHFKYRDIDANGLSRDIKPAVKCLMDAGLIYTVHATSASGLPFASTINERKFKLLFLDVGLVSHATHLDFQLMLTEPLLLLNRGALAEQFVGQELLAYGRTYEAQHLYYWEREKSSSEAEVDYVINIGANIIPLEVKAGKTGRLKSLHIFMQEKNAPLGIKVSQEPLAFDRGILSLPLYLLHELPRLVKLL